MDSGVDEKYAVKGAVSQALYAGEEWGIDLSIVSRSCKLNQRCKASGCRYRRSE
jgi:hypothetical protein